VSQTRTRRSRALVIVMAFAALLIGIVVPAPSAQAAPVLTGGASLSHPFSDPVWWPLDVPMRMDCYHYNPGCGIHDTWTLDVVSPNRTVRGPTAHEPVHAMGAGIAHWGVRADQKCGPPHPHSRGNWLWIDHGNGIESWYGHLAWPFKVPNGAYVTPKSVIGYIGNSGYSGCKTYPTLHYIDLAVKHGGKNGRNSGSYVQMKHLSACQNGQVRVYPDDVSRYTKWNDVPKLGRDHWTELPGNDRSCMSVPAKTPNRTSSVRLSRVAKASLRAGWARPTTGPVRRSTVVLIQEYHPTIHRWLELRKHVVSAGAAATTFTNLHLNHTFRVRVNFVNGYGVSNNSRWVSAVAR